MLSAGGSIANTLEPPSPKQEKQATRVVGAILPTRPTTDTCPNASASSLAVCLRPERPLDSRTCTSAPSNPMKSGRLRGRDGLAPVLGLALLPARVHRP